MKNTHVLILTVIAAAIAAGAPLIAQEGRPLRTMPHGTYQCALPGDATGDAYKVVESEGFTITTSSRYTVAEGGGTYLMRGRDFVFTSGPRKDQKFKRMGSSQLQRVKDDGSLDRLLCTRLSGTG
ncbi:MAG: elongation factor P [Pseudomonadota bacterium]